MAMMRGLDVAEGTKVWPRRLQARFQCGAATAKEMSYAKDSRFVSLGYGSR
jgi:hypothetical protein